MERIQAKPRDDYVYLGIALYGPKRLENKFTGNIPLLR